MLIKQLAVDRTRSPPLRVVRATPDCIQIKEKPTPSGPACLLARSMSILRRNMISFLQTPRFLFVGLVLSFASGDQVSCAQMGTTSRVCHLIDSGAASLTEAAFNLQAHPARRHPPKDARKVSVPGPAKARA
jgi:hypothetical protein